MFDKLRPFIFKFSPEVAHSLAIKALKLNAIPKKKIENQSILKTEIFNKTLENPIGVAAGFDKNAEVYNSLFNLGFGFVEVGTITPEPQYGNPKPRVFRLEEDEALINRLGFNNSGSNEIYNKIEKNKSNGFLGINIGPNKTSVNRVEDYIKCLNKFYNVADYITINISSPNTENLRNFHKEEEMNNLLSKIKEEKEKLKPDLPIAVKISPDIENKSIEDICDILVSHSIDLLIISNTTEKNRETLKNINKLEKGGLSGKPVEKRSNELVKLFYKNLKNKIKIIGVGGVSSGKDAYEKIIRGASLVQLYTGMVYRGPDIANKINKELIEILTKEGVKNISQIVGSKN
jgi:dihydroorotate dehydrogenase